MKILWFALIVLYVLSGCASPKDDGASNNVLILGKDREKQGLWVDFKDAYLIKSGYTSKAEHFSVGDLNNFIYIADNENNENNVRVISLVLLAAMYSNGLFASEIETYFQDGLYDDESIICYHSVMFCLNFNLIVDRSDQENILANLIYFAETEQSVNIREYIMESLYDLSERCRIEKGRLYEICYKIGGDELKNDMIKYIGLYELKNRGALFFDYSSTETLWLDKYN